MNSSFKFVEQEPVFTRKFNLSNYKLFAKALVNVPPYKDKMYNTMINITGKGGDTILPELFQIIKFRDGGYKYFILEQGTHKTILTDVIDIYKFVPHINFTKRFTVELIHGPDFIDPVDWI
jgi:hypothetical protein